MHSKEDHYSTKRVNGGKYSGRFRLLGLDNKLKDAERKNGANAKYCHEQVPQVHSGAGTQTPTR